MAEFTPNYNMKKPSDDDFYNVRDFNNNADIVDDELKKQSNRINATEYPIFTEANVDENIQSKESLPTLLGKIKRTITKISEHISADNPHTDSATKKHKHSTEDLESGTLPLSRGGTGANTAAEALKKLGITVTASVINLLNGLNENIIDALAKKSDTDHEHTASEITSGTFSVSRIPNLEISKINNLDTELEERQSATLLEVGSMLGGLRDTIEDISPGANNKYFPINRNSAGIICIAGASKAEDMGLWYFSSSEKDIAVVPIVNNSSFEVFGTTDFGVMNIFITNNSSKTCRAGAIFLHEGSGF